MNEAFVQLRCPACTKHWEAAPMELPDSGETFRCPDCDETRPTAEFMRTDRNLEILNRL